MDLTKLYATEAIMCVHFYCFNTLALMVNLQNKFPGLGRSGRSAIRRALFSSIGKLDKNNTKSLTQSFRAIH